MHGRLERRAESDRGMVGGLYDEDLCGFASPNGMTGLATGEFIGRDPCTNRAASSTRRIGLSG